MKLLFLDMDGVMNNHQRMENGYCGIRPECVKNLNKILNYVNCDIVISSAWRYMIPSTMSITGFEYMLMISGVCCRGRVIGHTRRDLCEPDDRGDQIRDYLIAHENQWKKYVILDDMEFNFKKLGLIYVQTDGKVGLTEELADKAIQLLK